MMKYILEEKIQRKISKDFKESINGLHNYFANADDTDFLDYLHEKLQHELKYIIEAHKESIRNKIDAEFKKQAEERYRLEGKWL